MKTSTKHPYAGLPDSNFWRKAVSAVERFHFDPVTDVRFTIGKTDQVSTAGSCFAQHISSRLQSIGFNYQIVEQGADFDAVERRERNYGVFSARYGNLYSARQLLQLAQEAFGERTPADKAWKRGNVWVDPLRPNIEPNGFPTLEAVQEERQRHLSYVRQMLATTDIFVFTLGLTEAWRAKSDGTVFPLAPGVSGGSYDPEQHEFVNFSAREVTEDMASFIELLRRKNPKAKILLTVSPVPLIATYEPRHVMCSTVLSKSVLRVAADELYRTYNHVDYFPSFEIITGNYNHGYYWEADLREVNSIGVGHAMSCFLKHYAKKIGKREENPVG